MIIISGGQTGADRAGLDAAKALGFERGGWCPKDRRAEDGRIPDEYELIETDSPGYGFRTEKNIVNSDATVIFTNAPSLEGGSLLTVKICRRRKKRYLHLYYPVETSAILLRNWVQLYGIQTLNVAGTRASRDPLIYRVTYDTLIGAFRG